MDVHEARRRVEVAFREAGIPEMQIVDDDGLRRAYGYGIIQDLIIERESRGRGNGPITQWPGTCYEFMLVILMYLQDTAQRGYTVEVYWEGHDKRWILDHGRIYMPQEAAA